MINKKFLVAMALIIGVGILAFNAGELNVIPKTLALIIFLCVSTICLILLSVPGKDFLIGSGLISIILASVIFTQAVDFGLINKYAGLVFLLLWGGIGYWAIEYACADKNKSDSKKILRANYILINIAQMLMIIVSVFLLFMKDKIILAASTGNADAALLTGASAASTLFLAGLLMFLAFFSSAFFSKDFLSDFSRALLLIPGNEYEQEQADSELKKMAKTRLLTFILLIIVLICFWLVMRSKVIDFYFISITGKNAGIDRIIFAFKNFRMPAGLVFLFTLGFFWLNIVMMKELIQFFTGKNVFVLDDYMELNAKFKKFMDKFEDKNQ